MLNARTPASLSIKMQAAACLEFEAVKQVAVPNIALAATSGKRRSAVDQTFLVDADHAHLLHGVDESDVPGGLVETEGGKRSSSNWVVSYALVGRHREWCLASFCLGVVFGVPSADCRIELRRRIGVDSALLSNSVGADKSSEIYG
jgi:hypothetical protein